MSDEKRELMKARIAEVANDLFQTEGYAKVSMRKIAREVGCTPMALYTYYDAKIDILRTVWGRVFDAVFSEIEAVQSEASSPRTHLLDISKIYVRYWLDHPDHYRLVFMADGVTQPDVSLFLDDDNSAVRFAVFGHAIHAVSPSTMEDIKLKLDFLTCLLHGIAHSVITISDHSWTSADTLIHIGIEGLFREAANP